jgi:hypothetical protein
VVYRGEFDALPRNAALPVAANGTCPLAVTVGLRYGPL